MQVEKKNNKLDQNELLEIAKTSVFYRGLWNVDINEDHWR